MHFENNVLLVDNKKLAGRLFLLRLCRRYTGQRNVYFTYLSMYLTILNDSESARGMFDWFS